MQLESALGDWRQWDGELQSRPEILGPLSSGRSNHSFLLDAAGHRMVLRLNGEDTNLPGASRKGENNIWAAASAAGIAPPLLHIDEQKGYLVSDYIANNLPSQLPINDVFIDQAFGLLDRCHQLDVEAPSIDYASHVDHYWQAIEKKDCLVSTTLNGQREPMREVMATLINSHGQTGLCHHDPVITNFVGGLDRLYLIDWEYAAHGLVVMDYAALGTEWDIDDASILKHSGVEPDMLKKAQVLYKYLCALWEEIIT